MDPPSEDDKSRMTNADPGTKTRKVTKKDPHEEGLLKVAGFTETKSSAGFPEPSVRQKCCPGQSGGLPLD